MSAYMERTPRARKPHRCDECGATIPAGQVYLVSSGIWEGAPFRFRFHAACHRFRVRYNAHLTEVNRYGDETPLGGLEDEFHPANHATDAPWLVRWRRLGAWMARRYGVAA